MSQSPSPQAQSLTPRPLGLLAELTYRCPLHCPYCSNPTEYPKGQELSVTEWKHVFSQAQSLGVLHALLSGGEPLARPDLTDIVAAASAHGLYTNLITSAVGLTLQKAQTLKDAGLDAVQISFQSDDLATANAIAGAQAHAQKLQAAQFISTIGLPLTINVVLHRQNIERIPQIVALAERLGARRLELANTQYYGWAFRNRQELLPTPEQVTRAGRDVDEARARLAGPMQILYVAPDLFLDRPKPCMNGWARQYLTINPIGDVLPCPTAFEIQDLHFENVKERDLRWIWTESDSFNRFRGTQWMSEPCRSCSFREIDFGGCRCQAALLTGNAANADPVCSLSPQHHAVIELLKSRDDGRIKSGDPGLNKVSGFNSRFYRTNPEAKLPSSRT